MSVAQALREVERAKYIDAYEQPEYGLHSRRQQVKTLLTLHEQRGSYLDIACGRGETLEIARANGYSPVHGTEIVPDLVARDDVTEAWGHDLPFPDDSVDVVTCFDVLEHVLPSDEVKVLEEVRRVARKRVALTISNLSSKHCGHELHINRLPYNVWDALIRRVFEDWAVLRGRVPCGYGGNESWECWRA